MPPFSVVCFKCAPKDLKFLREHHTLYQQKLFYWALKVKIRDKHLCQICLALEIDPPSVKERNLTAHHIFPLDLFPELMFFVENGITLCDMHHKSLHTKQYERIKEEVLKNKEVKEFLES